MAAAVAQPLAAVAAAAEPEPAMEIMPAVAATAPATEILPDVDLDLWVPGCELDGLQAMDSDADSWV